MNNFEAKLNIQSDAATAFQALTGGIREWWSAAYEGDATKIGGRFTVRFDNTFKTFEVAELVENKRIVWRCVDSYLDVPSLANKAEWNDTLIIWDISPQENFIVLDVTHQGLTPAIGCYEACRLGWDYFLHNSLIPYLEIGAGQAFSGKA